MKNLLITIFLILSLLMVLVWHLTLRGSMLMSVKRIDHNDISLYTESFGDKGTPAVLLISGAGAPARFWSDSFCKRLVAAGYFVIRYDHRDQGLSSGINFVQAPYTVKDLVQDAVAILDGYGSTRVHIVGHSMGGTIAQLLAIYHPERVKSMTSLSVGTVGHVAAPLKETMDVLLENKPTQQFEQSFAGFMKSWVILNGDYPVDEKLAYTYTKDLYERSNHPVGVAWNHIRAQENLGDLTDRLKTISVPAFFIHGEKDPLIPLEAGRATSAAVPGAQMIVIPGMGHMIFSLELEGILAKQLLDNFVSVDTNE